MTLTGLVLPESYLWIGGFFSVTFSWKKSFLENF